MTSTTASLLVICGTNEKISGALPAWNWPDYRDLTSLGKSSRSKKLHEHSSCDEKGNMKWGWYQYISYFPMSLNSLPEWIGQTIMTWPHSGDCGSRKTKEKNFEHMKRVMLILIWRLNVVIDICWYFALPPWNFGPTTVAWPSWWGLWVKRKF